MPKKSLGQHFLKEPKILKRIISYAELEKEDVVVEVGAGMGDLTAFISQHAKLVVALEIDKNLIRILERIFSKTANVRILNEDALSFNYQKVSEEYNTPLKIIGNIPYYLSTALTTRLLKKRSVIRIILFMFQKEVAERITASPGSKLYGPLSIISQVYAHTTRLMNIERTYFSPPPKVDSVLIRFDLYQKPILPISDEKYFEKTLYALFAQRRKTLINTLAALGQGKKDRMIQLCKAVNIDPIRRAETLTIEELNKIISNLRYFSN